MHNVRISGFGNLEIINYNKGGVPFIHKIKIQPIIATNMYGVTETVSFLGVSTSDFCIENMRPEPELSAFIQVWELNDLTSTESIYSDDDQSWINEDLSCHSTE